MRKGISPMIAVVLLIAFTVAIGGILSLFLTGLTTTQTGITATEAEKQIKCARSVLEVSEVKSSLGTLDYANVTVSYSYGTEDLYNFSFYFIDDAGNSVRVTDVNPQYTKTSPFTPGMLQVWQINISQTSTALTGSSLETVRVQSICQDTYMVTAECKSGQVCME